MQINVHDVKNQKKDISAEIVISQKLLFFTVSVVKFNRSAFVLRKGDLKMSRQRDLPESMAWRIIGRLESGQTQRSVADAVGVARSVIARLWNRFQETGNVKCRPGQGLPHATTANND